MNRIIAKAIPMMIVSTSVMGCMTDRALLVSVPVASMSQVSVPKGQGVSQGEPGNVRYCVGEKALSTKERTVGLLDELVYRGQKKSKTNFLTDVQFFAAAEHGCYELDYKAGVVGAAGAGEKKSKPSAEQPES